MPNPSGEPKPTEAEGETSNSENLDQTESDTLQKYGSCWPKSQLRIRKVPSNPRTGGAQSPPVAEWAKPTNTNFTPDAEGDP